MHVGKPRDTNMYEQWGGGREGRREAMRQGDREAGQAGRHAGRQGGEGGEGGVGGREGE